MTLYYYIAADHELPTGSFGMKKTTMKLIDALKLGPPQKDVTPIHSIVDLSHLYEEETDVYETEEDAAGLYVSGPLQSQHTAAYFQHPFVYQIDPDGGSFCISKQSRKHSPTAYLTGRKCLTQLFSYIHNNLGTGGFVELYAAWAHGMDRFSEPPDRSLDFTLDLNTFELGDEFEWKERQYIMVKK
ncbi:hypothetical protein [Paenibacillus lutrae]|uniref:Uncharacterized protein n=1 Tax=Paenibacillus lutrae TaxID=2078573 RepID=A0A7X3K0G5_9BACL|nr:hypothetical protein [Paenibacillus lutrae]MVP01224.1 hypothetical protein [Paenibacillus lutrae]